MNRLIELLEAHQLSEISYGGATIRKQWPAQQRRATPVIDDPAADEPVRAEPDFIDLAYKATFPDVSAGE